MTLPATARLQKLRAGHSIAHTFELPKKKSIDLQSIRALRGISALLVTLFHLSVIINEADHTSPLIHFFKSGFGGVDVFFVISGFVITHSCWKKINRPDLWSLYIKARILRVYPVYWLTLSIFTSALLAAYQFFPSLKWLTYSFDYRRLLNTIFLAPQHDQLVPVTWTLSFELYFYTLFGFIVLSKRLVFVPVLVLIGTVANGIAVVMGHPYYFKYVFSNFFLSGFNIEFLFGVVACVLVKKGGFKFPLFLIPIALGVFLASGEYIQPAEIWLRVPSFGLAAFLLVGSLCSLEKAGKFRSPQWLLKVGDASFMLYLIHIPVLMVIKQALMRLDLASWVMPSCLLAGGFLCWFSFQVHRRVEKPLILFLNSKGKTKQRIKPGMIVHGLGLGN